tara:strand:- start:638 stop:1315 length:678 start_codon:yes stop_codon:yes gene_type:complete
MAITLSTDGYCAASDVAALLQQLTIDANSDPSTTEVETFITQYFGELGGMLVGANYVHPVSQSGGSLAVSAGTIRTEDAGYTSDMWLSFQGSGGTLSGVVRKGDFFTLGTAQRYAVTHWAEVDDDGQVSVRFSPSLENDVPASTVVTYTSGAGAANVLNRLNTLGAAIHTLTAAYGPDADPAIVDPIINERDRLYNAIKTRTVVLLGADMMVTTRTSGTSRLIRK